MNYGRRILWILIGIGAMYAGGSFFLKEGSAQSISQNSSVSLPASQSNLVSQLACNDRQILTDSSCEGDGLEPEERELYERINEYRNQNGLPSIALSPSLTLVANRHVQDLERNIGDLTHGWSDCPYDAANPETYECMWKAPQRLGTPYPGNGYENAHGGSGGYQATAVSALESWQGSGDHNAVILNQGMWQSTQWNALGIGISGGYAVLWFGEEPDPAAP
jgi:hypothetical protein